MQTDLSDSSLFNHKSVMTDEILVSVDQYPLISDNKLTAIDATLGGGGHSYQLLKKYWNTHSKKIRILEKYKYWHDFLNIVI